MTSIFTVTVVGATKEATYTSVFPSEPAAVGYLRDMFEEEVDLADAETTEEVVAAISATEEVEYVMVDEHDLP
ncbi:hypothetical protein PBI_HILLTOPFARM_118 [Mycobacterium phage Hilltopfarm]|nr:hypothetical protein PBI_HILLTOPFARM_118 [Mycobacterium phage Hilltopfarm]